MIYTAKPEYPHDAKIVAVVDIWSFCRGSVIL